MRRTPSLLATALAIAVLWLGASSAAAQGPAGKPQMSVSLSSVGINVADIARAEKFYAEVFGLERTFHYPPQGDPIEVGVGGPGGAMGLLLARLTDDPLPDEKSAYGRIVIMSDDARGLAERAIAAGAKMLRDLSSPNGPVILFLSDLDGYEFELYQAPAGE